MILLMASNPNDPYDFILNSQKQPSPPIIDLAGASMFKRLLIVMLGLIFLIIIAVFAMSFLNKSAKQHDEQMFGIIQSQTEIIRVAGLAEQKIFDQELLFKTNNVKLSFGSSLAQLSSAMASSGYKINDKKLAASENPENDALLLKGEQNGTFDQTYEDLLNDQLENYQSKLQSVYEIATPTEKTVLESSYEQVNLLLGKKSS